MSVSDNNDNTSNSSVAAAGIVMMSISLGLNSLILTPLTLDLFLNPQRERTAKVLGDDTQARRILCAMYTSINVLSFMTLLLTLLSFSSTSSSSSDLDDKAVMLSVPIFAMQIIYKTITAFYNKGWTPVIIANQFVTIFHLATLFTMWRTGLLDVYLK
jgi:magnesium-transporting ATPase (P-type)